MIKCYCCKTRNASNNALIDAFAELIFTIDALSITCNVRKIVIQQNAQN